MPDQIWATKNEHPVWMSPFVVAMIIIAILVFFWIFSPSSSLGPKPASHKEAVSFDNIYSRAMVIKCAEPPQTHSSFTGGGMRRVGFTAMLSMVMAIAVLAVPPPKKADAAVPVSVLPDVKPVCFTSGDPPSYVIHEVTTIATAYFNIGNTSGISTIGATAALEPSAPALSGRSQYSVDALPARYTKYGGTKQNTEINTAFADTSTSTGTRAAEPAYAMTVLDRTARMNE